MNKEEFLTLLDKYLEGKTNTEEDKLLINYFESFQEDASLQMNLSEQQKLKLKMLKRLKLSMGTNQKIERTVRKNRLPTTILKYAAFFAAIAGLFFLYVKEDTPIAKEVVEKSLGEDVNEITLKLNNGAVAIISQNDDKQIVDSKGNVIGVQTGNQIDYKKEKNNLNELVYNELTVPHGKKFDLVLSDGTQIKLNAGTAIRYPVKFIKGKNREVQIWGEAFFDVAKDKKHPFIVQANNLEVEVLGTKFNVSSYEEDENINTVLVEGSVQLSQKNGDNDLKKPNILKPDHKASLSKENGEMEFSKVDTDIYTAWTNGKLIFKNSPFKNIRRKLERHYNVTIVNNNKSLEEKTYNASFDIETIEQVMAAFKENYAIDYTITNNQIIIN